MDPKQARQIARHHLGEALTTLMYGGPYAADCASQLRAAGWVPTHPRLEWERSFDSFALVLRAQGVRCPLWSGKLYSNDTGWARNDNQALQYNIHPLPKAEVIAAWVAENLPYHLPPFPETPRDSV